METKNNFIQKFTNFILKYICIIIAIIIGILGICSIFITAYFDVKYNIASEITHFRFSIGILEILLALLFTVVVLFLSKKLFSKVKNTFILIPMFILLLVVFVFWVKVMRLEPIDDQFRVHSIALDFLHGGLGFHLSPTQYLFLYPYQFGIIYFTSLIYRIFGENFMNMQYLNCICSILSMILLYRITARLFKDEQINKIMIFLLLAFSLYWMFLNTQVYGNIPGLTFALIAILFTLKYIDSHNVLNVFIIGVTISISIILKTNYNIFLCGIVIVLILDLFNEWKIKKLSIIPIFLVGYFLINISYNTVIEKKHNVELPEGVPMINFIYMGMSDKSIVYPGWYNGETIRIYYDMQCNTEASKKEAKKEIGERLEFFSQNPNKFFEYYGKKIGSTWLNPTFQTIWYSSPSIRYMYNEEYATYISYHTLILDMVAGRLYKLEQLCFNAYEIVIMICASIAIWILALNKEISIKNSFIPIVFFGGFLFHILWETKSVYVIQYYYLLVPYAAYGLNYISNKIINKLKNRKLLEEKNKEAN